MRRLFWLSVGAGAGVYVTRRVNRFARQWAPENVAARAGEKILFFARDVRLQAGEREAQLREAIEHDRLGPPNDPARRDGRPGAAGEGTRPNQQRAVLPAPAAERQALAEGTGARRRALAPARPARQRALPEAPPRRVLKADYTIIDKNKDKDGH